MKRLLLTGASGFLGWNVMNVAQTDWHIYGLTNTKNLALQHVDFIKTDLTSYKQLKQLLHTVKPDGVIHCAANADPNYCQQHPQETAVINVDVPIQLAEMCAERQIPMVFTSTDLVFDGTKGNYCETDATNPINTYGEQKVLAEAGILTANPQAAVCRMPLMYGDGGQVAKSFMQPFLQKMRAGEPLSLFSDEYRSAVDGQSAAKGLLQALDGWAGIYHLGGTEKLSRYEFGLLLQQHFNLPNAMITPMSQKAVTMPAPRPADVTMNSHKAYAMGYQPLTSNEALQKIIS